MSRDVLALVFGCVFSLVAELIVAPAIGVFSITPCIVAAFLFCVAMVRPGNASLLIAFVLGFLLDAAGSSPLGVCAFSFTLLVFASSRLFTVLSAESFSTVAVFSVLSLLGFEVCREVLLVLCTSLSFADLPFMLLRYAIPAALYDCVVVLLVSPLVTRLCAAESPVAGFGFMNGAAQRGDVGKGPHVKSSAGSTTNSFVGASPLARLRIRRKAGHR